MFDLEKFKTGKYYVHLPTRKIYNEVMEFLDENNIYWITGRKTTERSTCYLTDGWAPEGHKTCVSYVTRSGKGNIFYKGIARGDKRHFEKKGCVELQINENSISISNLIDGNIKIEKTPNFNSSIKDYVIIHQQKENKHNDLVKSPNHYIGDYGLEVEEVLRNFISRYEDGYVAHRMASAIEYILRSPLKNGTQDLEKAGYNIQQALEHTKRENEDEEK